MIRAVTSRPLAPALRLLLFVIAGGVALLGACAAEAPSSRHLLILVDGLRPDYVTPEVMPNLTALGRRGAVFARHHSIYPTVTRVNASSISTGTYPGTHGLLGNSVFFPRVDATRFLDTGDRDALSAIERTEGHLLTAPTLGEMLQAAGRRMLVVSSGSTGSALLNNHTVAGGAILHYRFTLPEALGEDMKALGPAPAEGAPLTTLDRYAVDAFLKVGIPRVDPSVTVMWLGALDSTAHDHGIGDPATIAVLRHVDESIKLVEDGLRDAGLLDRYNIWVTSDHGFSTYTGAADVDAILQPFAATLPDGTPRIARGAGAIYVRDRDETAVRGIVKGLQDTPGIGAIFTPGATPGSFDGRVPGTLSFDLIRWQHARSAEIQYSPEWTDAANLHGVRGSTASNGVAGHGSTSPWDVRNTLVAAGPDVRKGITVDTPSANVDFAPTFLTLLGLPIPPSIEGRALAEAFANHAAGPIAARTADHTATAPHGRYAVTATLSIVSAGGREYRYFDGAQVARK